MVGCFVDADFSLRGVALPRGDGWTRLGVATTLPSAVAVVPELLLGLLLTALAVATAEPELATFFALTGVTSFSPTV
jgi:hypothetical protein